LNSFPRGGTARKTLNGTKGGKGGYTQKKKQNESIIYGISNGKKIKNFLRIMKGWLRGRDQRDQRHQEKKHFRPQGRKERGVSEETRRQGELRKPKLKIVSRQLEISGKKRPDRKDQVTEVGSNLLIRWSVRELLPEVWKRKAKREPFSRKKKGGTKGVRGEEGKPTRGEVHASIG